MPLPLIIIGGILLLFVLLLALPVHLTVVCREAVTLRVRVLFISLTLFPRKKKPVNPRKLTKKALSKKDRKAQKKAERRERRAARKAQKKARAAKANESAALPLPPPTLRQKLALVRALAAAVIRKTNKHLRLKAARIKIRVATGDAATTAILYGAVGASLSYLLAALSRVVRLKAAPRDIGVVADYLSEKSSTDIKLVFTLRVFGALALALHAGTTYLKTARRQRAERRKKAAAAASNKPSKGKEPQNG